MRPEQDLKPRDGLIAVASVVLALVWLFVGPYIVGVERNIPLAAGVALVGAFALFMSGGVLLQYLQAADRKKPPTE